MNQVALYIVPPLGMLGTTRIDHSECRDINVRDVTQQHTGSTPSGEAIRIKRRRGKYHTQYEGTERIASHFVSMLPILPNSTSRDNSMRDAYQQHLPMKVHRRHSRVDISK